MSEYSAPLRDMQFVLDELGYLDQVNELPGCEDLGADLVDAILGEAGKFAEGVLSPLNLLGDREGARWNDGDVTTAKGWQAAYGQFVEGGWNALSCHPEFGGQGLPRLVSALVEEMWNGANVSFGLCPMLSLAAIEGLRDGTLYLSTGGGWSPSTEAALRQMASRPEVLLVAATDANPQGEMFAERLRALADDVGCNWSRLRPPADDWNEALKIRDKERRERKEGGVPHSRRPRQGKLRPAEPALDPAGRDAGGPGDVMKD